MGTLHISSLILVIFLAISTNICYVKGYYVVVSQGWTEDPENYEKKSFNDLDSARKYWLSKYCRSKILFDTGSQRHLMSYSSEGRVADVMGKTRFFSSFISRNKFERGVSISLDAGMTDCALFSDVAVVAYYHDIDHYGVRIAAMAEYARQLQSDFDKMQATAKVRFQWTTGSSGGQFGHFFRHYIACKVHTKSGDSSQCDKLKHILMAMDHGHLYNQFYLKYVVAWCQEQEFHLAHFNEEQHATPLFESLPNCTAKVLLNRDKCKAIREQAAEGRSGMILFLTRAVATLNQVFPMGTWGASAKNARTWYDCIAKKYCIQVTLGHGDNLVDNQVYFDPRCNYYQYDGQLVEGNG